MRRDPDGTPVQLISIVEDVTDRKRAQNRLEESQEKLRAIYDGTYEYIGLLDPDGTVLECNRAALEFAGNTREDVVGTFLWETPWFTGTPGAPEQLRQSVARAAAGEFVRYEAALRRPSGEVITFDFSLHPIRNQFGEIVYLVPEGRNINDRKLAEARNAFLLGLDDAMRQLADPIEITQAAATMLGERLQVNRCAYAEVEQDEDTFNLTGDYNRGVESIVGRYTFAQFGQECLRLMRRGEPYIVEDSETDPRVAELVESYRRTSIRSVICVPLHKAGHLVAAMAVHQETPRRWRQDEVELVQIIANRCWESIERAHVARELREREQRFRFLAESIPQMVWTAAADGQIDYVNGRGLAYLGAEQSAVGVSWLPYAHPQDYARTTERWKACLSETAPFEITTRLRRGSDGTWRWHLVRAQPFLADYGVVQWFGTCTDIEDQKQAEASLQQQWQTFDTALSHTPDFTYIFDLEGRFTYVNRALLSLWQKPLEEARGKNFFDLEYPAELAARLQEQIQRVISGGTPVRDTTPFTGPTGETRAYEYIFVPVFDEGGRVEAVAGSTRDVTEQNQAAQQIADDRRRWRELLMQTPAAVAVLNGPDHRFQWANDEFIRIVGRPGSEMVGKTVAEVVPEVEGQPYVALLNQVFQKGVPFEGHELPLLLYRQDGAIREFFINLVFLPTRNSSGEIDGVFCHATDVTEMVVARKQLEDSEAQFRTLAESIPHLAWMADEKGNIFWYNRRWYDYTATTFQQIQSGDWNHLHDPAILPEVMRRWQAAIDTGTPMEMVFPLRGGDGMFRTFLTRVEPVKDSKGNVVRWFGTHTDITEQQKAEEALRRTNRELEEFAYVASHDLQEPLRMVNIYTHLILNHEGESQERVDQYAGFVREGVTRMESLIRDLLTFSRTVHSEELPTGTANLNDAVVEALSVLKGRIEENDAWVEIDPLPLVRGDTSQLAHVFQNIVANSLKYRKPDVPPMIRISATQTGDRQVIAVQDNGIGFEQKYAERIFGLFKRLHKDEYQGTGLGLAICKRIVERYGGQIWAEGKSGEGATFYFSLPVSEGIDEVKHSAR